MNPEMDKTSVVHGPDSQNIEAGIDSILKGKLSRVIRIGISRWLHLLGTDIVE